MRPASRHVTSSSCGILGLLLCSAAVYGSSDGIRTDYRINVQLMYDSHLAQYFNSSEETSKYLTTFIQQVNTILAHESLSRMVRLKLSIAENLPRQLTRQEEWHSGIYLLRRQRRDSQAESASVVADASIVLRRFCRLMDAKRVTRQVPDFGHAFLLAGATLPTLGISYQGGACWPGADCALLMVPRRRLFRIAFTAAHELGHGLRLGHHGSEGDESSEGRSGGVSLGGTRGVAVMSDRLAADWPDEFRWVPESARQLRREIEEIEQRQICISKSVSRAPENPASNSDANKKLVSTPMWQPDRVCQLVTDGAQPYSQLPFKSMQCRTFCCRSASSAAGDTSGFATADCPVRVGAFDGVACGNSSGRCREGTCVLPQQQPRGHWFVLPGWSPCSVTCGQGTRSRRLQCGLRQGFKFKPLPDDQCSGETRPKTGVSKCQTIDCSA